MDKNNIEILQELLDLNLKRLRVNVDFEKESKMVYPEGSQITKIILQIESELYQRKTGKKYEEIDESF